MVLRHPDSSPVVGACLLRKVDEAQQDANVLPAGRIQRDAAEQRFQCLVSQMMRTNSPLGGYQATTEQGEERGKHDVFYRPRLATTPSA